MVAHDISSPAKSTKSNKKLKDKNVLPVTIEDVFNQISNASAQDINPPLGRTLLTPRSAEACLKLGANPELLKLRDIDSFWEPNVDPAVQRLRHEAYIQRRHELMKQCRQERKRVMNREFEQATTIQTMPNAMTPEMILAAQKEAGSTLIQLELARIQKMQKRQEKELESMIQYEVTRAKVQQDMAERLEDAKKKELVKKKQQEKRLALMAEERRLKELQRATQEEVEEQNRRQVAKSMHEKELELAAMNLKKERERKKEAIAAEIQKRQKQEEYKRQTAQYFADEEARLRKRLEDMNGAEEKKQAAIMAKQAEHAEIVRQRRAAIEARLETNFAMAKQVEDKRKNDFLEKQEHHEYLRSIQLTRQEQERRLHYQELEMQEQRRRMILIQMKRDEERKAEGMLSKFEEEEIHVMEIEAIKRREHQIQNEKKILKKQMKLENVERVQRVKEYQRMGTLKKIEDVDKRVSTMLEQRTALIQDRRKAAAQTKNQKEQISKLMEEIRTNASKAKDIITKAMSGKVNLADIAGGKKDKKSTKSNKTSKLRNSYSASDVMNTSNSQSLPSLLNNDDNGPRAYISPYDENL
jgi:hypothetical protein